MLVTSGWVQKAHTTSRTVADQAVRCRLCEFDTDEDAPGIFLIGKCNSFS